MNIAALIEQARAAGVKLTLVDGQIKARGKREALAQVLEPLRQHRADLIRWFTQAPANDLPADPREWRELAQAYYLHHWTCKACIAGGQGRGLRCGVGAAMWNQYDAEVKP